MASYILDRIAVYISIYLPFSHLSVSVTVRVYILNKIIKCNYYQFRDIPRVNKSIFLGDHTKYFPNSYFLLSLSKES